MLFHYQGETFSLPSGAGCPERLWNLHPCSFPEHNWTQSWATCSRGPCSEQGVGLVDLQESLPNLSGSAIKWLCDSVIQMKLPLCQGYFDSNFRIMVFGILWVIMFLLENVTALNIVQKNNEWSSLKYLAKSVFFFKLALRNFFLLFWGQDGRVIDCREHLGIFSCSHYLSGMGTLPHCTWGEIMSVFLKSVSSFLSLLAIIHNLCLNFCICGKLNLLNMKNIFWN